MMSYWALLGGQKLPLTRVLGGFWARPAQNPFGHPKVQPWMHFNALMLLYVHKDILLEYGEIIRRFAAQHPRRMLLQNPLQ
jgi:hypothetical protein